jgi:hypothetical protein
VHSGAELDTLQTRRDLQDDPLARVGLLLRFLEGYAVFMPGSAGMSAAISTSSEISSFEGVDIVRVSNGQVASKDTYIDGFAVLAQLTSA